MVYLFDLSFEKFLLNLRLLVIRHLFLHFSQADITRLIQALSEQAKHGAEVVQELKSAETRLKVSDPKKTRTHF